MGLVDIGVVAVVAATGRPALPFAAAQTAAAAERRGRRRSQAAPSSHRGRESNQNSFQGCSQTHHAYP